MEMYSLYLSVKKINMSWEDESGNMEAGVDFSCGLEVDYTLEIISPYYC